jgi:hypothetical protein
MYREITHHTVDELEEEISSAVIRITADTLCRVAGSFWY